VSDAKSERHVIKSKMVGVSPITEYAIRTVVDGDTLWLADNMDWSPDFAKARRWSTKPSASWLVMQPPIELVACRTVAMYSPAWDANKKRIEDSK
jgi:hypothetical protein